MISFFKQYFPYYRDYKPYFVFGLIGILLASSCTAALAYLIKPVLDDIFVKHDSTMLSLLPFLVVLVYVGKSGGGYLQAYCMAYIGKDIVRRVRDRVLSHLIDADMAFFNQSRGGELISRLTSDIGRIQAAASSHLATIGKESLTAVGLISMAIYQSPKLAFFGLVVLPLAFYPLSWLAARMKKISMRSQEKNSDLTSHLNEIFNNIEIIKASCAERYESKRFEEHNRAVFSLDMKSVKTGEAVNPLMEIVGSIAAAVVIVLGGQEVMSGGMSVGAFFSFLTALFLLYTPIRQISSVYNKFQDAIAANDRINELLTVRPNVKDGFETADEIIEQVELSDVTLSYGSTVALDGINLTLNRGECVALVGESGGGKSSLVALLSRFYDPSGGAVLANGKDIRSFTLQSLRKRISTVTQRVYIFGDTVASNVAYGETIDEARVKEALRSAHALEFVEALPHGIDTKLEEFGANLSGGQRQRIAIARALYKNPSILILDEATSALDNESEREVMRAIDAIAHDRIVVLIAHRLSTVRNAKKLYLFKGGKIVCEGSEQLLLQECEEYKRLSSQEEKR